MSATAPSSSRWLASSVLHGDRRPEQLRGLAHALAFDLVELPRRSVDQVVEVDPAQLRLGLLGLLERLPQQQLPGDASASISS